MLYNKQIDIEQGQKNVLIYEAQLQGIRCTGCRNKIVENLTGFMSIQAITINIIAEKALVSLTNPSDLNDISQKIVSLGFKVVSDFNEISLSNNNNSSIRNIYFQLPQIIQSSLLEDSNINQEFELLKNLKNNFKGVLEVNLSNRTSILTVKYNFKATRGCDIVKYLSEQYKDQNIECNPYVEGFKKSKVNIQSAELKDVQISLGIMALFITFTMILPYFDIFETISLYPQSMSIMSFYVIGMLSLTVFTMYYFGKRIFLNAFNNYFKYKTMNMETLVAIGCFSSLLLTLFLIFTYFIEEYNEIYDFSALTDSQIHSRSMKIHELVHMMETASLILTIITIGKYHEGKVKKSILSMSEKLFPENQLLQNTQVTLIEPKNKKFDIDREQNLDVSYLDRDDFMIVKAPFRLLNDVTLVHQISNEIKASDQILYGQNDSFIVKKGQMLRSGAEIVEGEGIVQINHSIEDSLLYQTSKQLNLAQNNSESSESGISGLLKKLSEIFVKTIIIIASITLAFWVYIIISDSFEVPSKCHWCFPIERFISVLVASCPCALGLAIPSVITTSLNLAMQNSILIKKNSVFEKISKIKAIVFDKTGTLFTKANHIDEFDNLITKIYNDDQIWQMIQQLEKSINHPLAELLYMEAVQRQCNILSSDFQLLNHTKKQSKNGISATLLEIKRGNKQIKTLIGNLAFMNEHNITISNEKKQQIEDEQKQGSTVILMSINENLASTITLHNTTNLRPEAQPVIDFLTNNLKKEVYILSGDSKDTVLQVGKHLGIKQENLIGECDSQGKRQLLINLRKNQKKEVMMVGDGLNDILSLEEACIGVSINAKSELNLMASDIVVLNENLWRIVYIFQLVKKSKLFIYINLFWAFSYNLFMIPIAAGCFYSFGLKITPLISTIAMSSSSILVVLFSSLMKLNDFKIPKQDISKNILNDINSNIELTQDSFRNQQNNDKQSIISVVSY